MKKRKMYILTKKVETFNEGMTDLYETCDAVNSLYVGVPPFEGGATKVIMDLISKDMPSITDPAYPNTYAISVKANGVFFRTKKDVSFGWKYDRDSLFKGKKELIFEIILVTPQNRLLIVEMNKTMQALKNRGWVREDLKTKSTHKLPANKPDVSADTVLISATDNQVSKVDSPETLGD